MKKIFKVAFYLRSNYRNKEGKIPLMLRIYLNNERINIGAVGISIVPELWDNKKLRLKGRTAEILQINQQLEQVQSTLQLIFHRQQYDPDISLDRIKSEYLGKKEEFGKISSLFGKVNGDVKEQIGITLSYATYRRYEVTKRLFMEFLAYKYKRKDMNLNEITSIVIHDFEIYLHTFVGYKNNTAVKMMKQLKTVILFAKKAGYISHDPFLNHHFHRQPTDRGFLTEAEIKTLATCELKLHRLEVVRDIFLFSCFTGLAYVDVVNLTEENIVELNGHEWIMTKRQKTNIASNILLLDYPKLIIEKYAPYRAKGGRLLPILSNQKMNSYLKEIAEICGIKKRLSFHLARHSFATMTLSKGVPIESVSKMLGHTNIRTTQIYARITNKKIEQDMLDFAGKLDSFEPQMSKKYIEKKNINQ
ncbi:site-specific integrase [Bacteroides heparinolyticus]|uniref:site-specific integrase n=1 Tax=Prevotella heparinolytica TaxID=28113 RepID=UPI0035A1001B